MRTCLVLVLLGAVAPLGCATSSPAGAERAAARVIEARPAASRMIEAKRAVAAHPAFLRDRAVYMLTVEDAGVSCQAWRMDAFADRPGEGVLIHRARDGARRIETSYGFDSRGATLELHTPEQAIDGGDDDWHHLVGVKESFEIGQHTDTYVEVDGAYWFFAREACEAALAAKLPVAMDHAWAELDDDELDVEASRVRFEQVLRRGGVIYGDECLAWNVDADPKAAGAGRIARRFKDRDAEVFVSYSFRYDEPRRELTVTSPYIERTEADGTGTAGAYGCFDQHELQGRDNDAVSVSGALWYLTEPACRQAEAARAERQAWFPPEEDEWDEDGEDEQDEYAAVSMGGFGC